MLQQTTILDNLILTGLRGVGKSVLLDEFKPVALQAKWLWVGTDLSESASISETNLAHRLITDLSVVTGVMSDGIDEVASVGFSPSRREERLLSYDRLMKLYNQTPGLVVDRLKAVFDLVAPVIAASDHSGIIFAYDEAQNLSDHAAKDQYPLSLLLELFQSVQRKGVPFMLLLAGLPTLFPKLVEARTYAERMFRVIFLKQLSEQESKEAITKPIEQANCPVKFQPNAAGLIYRYSGGYPYFIQFICREAYDAWLQRSSEGKAPSVPITEIIRKLDTDFFAGRWARVTDRQQELLFVISGLETHDGEFTVQDILGNQELLSKPFSRSHINQMLTSLIGAGLVYRDRHGKYLFAVPLMADFIRRSLGEAIKVG